MLFGKHINKYYIKHFWTILLGIFALVVVDWFQLVIPEIYKNVINGINDGKVIDDGVEYIFNMDYLLDKICLPLIFVIIFMVIGRFLWRVCFFGSAIKVETDLRHRMFDKCKDLSQRYYQENKVGSLMSLFTNDLETIQECFGDGMLMMFDALLLGILAVIKMFRMNIFLTLLSLIPMALMFLIGTIIGKRMMDKWEIRQEAFSSLSDFSQESFSGISVVKAFVKELKELLAFEKLNKKNEEVNVSYTKTSVLLRILVAFFIDSVITIILGYGGYLVYKGVFNAGQLVEFIGYFNAIIWPVMAVSELIDMTSRGKASLKRVSELLDEKSDIYDGENVYEIGDIKGEIEFENLTFRYPGADYDALKNVSFKINIGERVGITGKTGCGKTTIVDLILRTYNVPDDTLFVDGRDINTIPVKSLRKYCAYVPQDNFLFSDTIENNIAFATDDVTEEKIIAAAKNADIHGNISEFTLGYKTVLGERGVTVSGGQKQRISIARALMKDAPILILDDSVSAVDVKTEKTILENLSRERQNKTTILIAHRVSTMENLDKIIFVSDGRISAVGTHEELYRTNREYKNLVDLQRLDALA